MAEQNDQVTYDSFDTNSEKSSAPLWISFVIGSLILSFIGTFMWVLYVEEPSAQEQQIAMSDSLMVTDTTQTDSTLIANTITPADSLAMLKDSLMALHSGLEVANKTIEQLSDTAEQEINDYRQLAKIYSQMDAEAAAEILSKLDDAMIVGILEKMRDRNAAELLAVIERNRAAQLSEKLTKPQRVN